MATDQNIQDAIEHGALDEALGALRLKLNSSPSDPYYLALDALASSRQALWKVAYKKGQLAIARVPSDPRALSVLYEVFRRPLNHARYGIVNAEVPSPASTYENAIRKYPIVGEKLADSWLQCAIKAYDIAESSRVFNVLFRVCKESAQYRWWLALGYLWLLDGDVGDRDRQLYSKLAFRLVQDILSNTLMELWLHFNVAAAAKEQEFLDNLDIPNNPLTDLSVQLLYCEWLRSTENWPQLSKYCLTLLAGGFDDYDTWTWLIEAAEKESTLPQVSELLSSVPSSRNTHLIGILLARAMNVSIEPALDCYFRKYASKLCCFSDILRYFAENPSLIDRAMWNDRLVALSKEIIESNDRRRIADLITIVNTQKLLYTMHHTDPDWVRGFVATNWTLYKAFRPRSASDFDSHPASQLALMLVLADLHRDHSYPTIVRLAVILVQLLEADPHNPMLMLWVMKITSNLNTNNLAPLYYDRLKIKMIQHDTLGHYFLPANPSKDHSAKLIRMFQTYLTGDREIQAGIDEGLKAGVYPKLRGFMALGHRLEKLYTRHLVALALVRLCLMLNDNRYFEYFGNYLRANHDRILDEKIDNRDYNVEYQALGLPQLRIPGLSAPIEWATSKPGSSVYTELAVYKYMSFFLSRDDAAQWIEQYDAKVVTFINSKVPVAPCDIYVHRLTAALLKYHHKRSFPLEYTRARKFLLKHMDYLRLLPYIEKDPATDMTIFHELADAAAQNENANPIYADNLELPRGRVDKLPSLLGWHVHYNLQNVFEVIKMAQLWARRSGDLGLNMVTRKLLEKLVKAKYGEKQRVEYLAMDVDGIPAECVADPEVVLRNLSMFADSVQQSLDSWLKL